MKTILSLISLLLFSQCKKEETESNFIEISPIFLNGEIPTHYKVTILSENLHQETQSFNSHNNENFYDAEQTTYIQTFIIENPIIGHLYKSIIVHDHLTAIDSVIYTGGIVRYKTTLKND